MPADNDTPPDAGRPSEEIKIDIDPKIGESLQGGMDAIGKVFGGLVGVIKDAVGPELMKGIEVSGWLSKLAKCLESIATGLRSDGTVPSEAAGQLSFFTDQFDEALAGSKLETQQDALKAQLQTAHDAIAAAGDDQQSSADAVSKAAGYFKAAAASCVPVPKGNE